MRPPFKVWVCPWDGCRWIYPDPPACTDGVHFGAEAEAAAEQADEPIIQAAYAEHEWLCHVQEQLTNGK